MKRITLICFIIIISETFELLGTDTITNYPHWFERIGFTSSFDYYNFSTDLRQIPSIPDSIRYFANGYNTGFSLGFYLASSLSPKLSLHSRFLYMNGFANISGKAWSEELISNKSTNSLIDHKFSTDVSSFTLEPLLEFEALKNVSILGGFLFSYRLNKICNHTEDLLKPDTGLFNNGFRSRKIENEFDNYSGFQLAVTGGISYKLPFKIANNGKLILCMIYSYGFSNISDNFIWDMNITRVGINFEYSINGVLKKEEYPTFYENNIKTEEEPKDTISQITQNNNETKLNIDLIINGVSGEIETALEKIEILESINENTFPLLNYIFFENNSSTIPDRYYQISHFETKNYELTKRAPFKEELNNGIKSVYYDILNIIGYRLQHNKDLKITIIGCNSDTLEEKGNTKLSQKRADAIKSYLTNIWDISKDRIDIDFRNLPYNPSNNNTIDGIEENQRVEIISKSPELFEPVVFFDTSNIIQPSILRFKIKKSGIKRIREWKILINQGSEFTKEITSKEDFPEYIDINLNDKSSKFTVEDSIIIKAYFNIINDQEISDSISLTKKFKLTKRKYKSRNDTNRGIIIEKYNLILFDFNKAVLDKEKLRVLESINNKINNNNNKIVCVKVIGYTDRIGDSNYNKELSKIRAVETAKYINFHPKNVIGYGEEKPIFDNTLPEGRFYSRTVEIIIERVE